MKAERSIFTVISVSGISFLILLAALTSPETRPWAEKICDGLTLMAVAGVCIAGAVVPFLRDE